MKDAYSEILETKVITICRRIYGEDLLRLAEALCKGGVRCIEVTFDQVDQNCMEKTQTAIRSLKDSFGASMHIGAGTVLSKEQVLAAADAGAEFIISPNVDSNVIDETLGLGLLSIPGAMTPSEILMAHNRGSQLIKLFPAGTLGPKYLKDIKAPISHVPLLATGGITEDNFADYLHAGACGAGISGRLTDRKVIEAKDFEEFTKRAKSFTDIAKEVSR